MLKGDGEARLWLPQSSEHLSHGGFQAMVLLDEHIVTTQVVRSGFGTCKCRVLPSARSAGDDVLHLERPLRRGHRRAADPIALSDGATGFSVLFVKHVLKLQVEHTSHACVRDA